ncbi:hypothetical protein BIWAKO_04901 [Bosea sp. BIWAKO-01]|nr:hypothetical protein BIWAKO_04901 [Bosea sp. BIWAKO-01]
MAAKPDRPDILIERDGSGILVRGGDGRMTWRGNRAASCCNNG